VISLRIVDKAKFYNSTQRQTVKPDEVRPPSILAADLARPIIPTAPSTPRTDGEGTESHSTHEGSVATDDSVSHRQRLCLLLMPMADALLGRINSHSYRR
jgi:hypothetical protein